MRLGHEQEEILLAVQPQKVHHLQVVDAPERKVEQRGEVLVACGLRSLVGFNKVTQFGAEQGVNGRVGLGTQRSTQPNHLPRRQRMHPMRRAQPADLGHHRLHLARLDVGDVHVDAAGQLR